MQRDSSMISAEQFNKFFDQNLSEFVVEKMNEIQNAEKKEFRIAAVLWGLAALCLLLYVLSRSIGFDLIDGFAEENRKYWLYTMFAFIGIWVISLLFSKSDELVDVLDKEVYQRSAAQLGFELIDAKLQFDRDISVFNVLRQMAAAKMAVDHVGFTTSGYSNNNVSLTLEANDPQLLLAFERVGVKALEVELSASQEHSTTDSDDNEESERATKQYFSGLVFSMAMETESSNFCVLPEDVLSEKDGGVAELETLLFAQAKPCSIEGYLLLADGDNTHLSSAIFSALESESGSLGEVTHKYIQVADGNLLVMLGFEQRPLCNGVCRGSMPARDIYTRLEALSKLQSSLAALV